MDGLSAGWQGQRPSQRERIILYPKAYESPASKVLPVLEALRLGWDRIKPCQVYLTAIVQDEVEYWFRTLPEEIQQSCRLLSRVPRTELMDLMLKSRVLLSPSLTDGIPNSLYEAMACGTFPIFSPLETITPVVKEETNVLYARNLYPQEIADALARAMQDDRLVDSAAKENLALVRQLADRTVLGPKLVKYYEELSEKNFKGWRAALFELEGKVQIRENQMAEKENQIQQEEVQVQQKEEEFSIREKSLGNRELTLNQYEADLVQREKKNQELVVQLNSIEVNLNNLKNDLNQRELQILQREVAQIEKDKLIERLQHDLNHMQEEERRRLQEEEQRRLQEAELKFDQEKKDATQKTTIERVITRIFGGK